MCDSARARASKCVRVSACERASVRACVRACVRVFEREGADRQTMLGTL